MHKPDAAIIVFAKEPLPGRAKTRMAAGLPPACAERHEFASALYAACLEDIFRTLGSQPLPVLLCLTPDSSPKYFNRFRPEQTSVQQGDNLGARMCNAFMQGFAEYGKLLLIGSDLPQLRAETLAAAHTALETHDCLLGPALDGGYYLIGFTKDGFCDCFSGVDWSTDKVLAQTLERLAGKKPFLLEPYRDLDTLEDLKALAASGVCPPSLSTFLRAHGLPNSL